MPCLVLMGWYTWNTSKNIWFWQAVLRLFACVTQLAYCSWDLVNNSLSSINTVAYLRLWFLVGEVISTIVVGVWTLLGACGGL